MNTKKRKCIMVLGMHRSGTSAMAGVLEYLGFNLGEDLMPASKFNPKGYFENNQIYHLNEAILRGLGVSWNKTYYLPAAILDRIDRKYIDQANEILANQFYDGEVIVLKDPRFSILSEFWKKILVSQGFDLYFVIMIREPMMVTRSLFQRDSFICEKSSLIWMDYMFKAERLTRNENRIFVNYDNLVENPKDVLINTFENLLFEFEHLRARIESVDDFLSKDLRHHFSDGENHDGRNA
ncbi:MAG: hypothetical protein KDC80_03575, partial [Saprospiraceae bacterium]|nr:hypothetical protein [Saprospiraceae bacterium]